MTDFYYTIIYGRKTENRKQGTGLYELASLWLSHEIWFNFSDQYSKTSNAPIVSFPAFWFLLAQWIEQWSDILNLCFDITVVSIAGVYSLKRTTALENVTLT